MKLVQRINKGHVIEWLSLNILCRFIKHLSNFESTAGKKFSSNELICM